MKDHMLLCTMDYCKHIGDFKCQNMGCTKYSLKVLKMNEPS